MSAKAWYLSVHWTARVMALLIAGAVFLFFFGEGVRSDNGYYFTASAMNFTEAALLMLVLGSAVAMLLAWFWEMWAGVADVVLAGAFLACCLLMERMHDAWSLGIALLLPGVLFVLAAALRHGKGNAATPAVS